MIEGNVRYISTRDGGVSDVILPIALYKRIIEELEDKELLRLMKEVETKSTDYLSEEESFRLVDDLVEDVEIQTQ